jgi:hypothetical protein
LSRIVILEVPDRYEITGKELLKIIRSDFPDIELRLSANFDWWKDICSKRKIMECLPLMIKKEKITNILDIMKNPMSIEERKGEKQNVK